MQLNSLFNHALACHQAGQLQQAANLYRQVLDIDGDHAHAFNNLGAIFLDLGHSDEAVSYFQKALNGDADFFEAYLNLAKAYKKTRRYSDATDSLRRALAINPDHIPAYLDLSFLCYQLGDTGGAISCCKKALELDPACVEAYNNLGNALVSQDDFQAAVESFERAIQLRPGRADSYYNLANACKSAGQVDGAIENYRRALMLKPGFVEACWNLSHALLLSGNFPAGWQAFECRFRLSGWKDIYPRQLSAPRWDGSDFNGRRLLVHDEQGLGDTLQFIRFLPLVKARGGTVIFETRQPLLKLLEGFCGLDELVLRSSGPEPAVDFDMYIPLMSLPALFGTTLSTIPARIPYLSANPGASAVWRGRLKGKTMQVGIVWAGNPGHANDQNRSCALERLKPLAKIGGLRLIGLQSGLAAQKNQRILSEMGITNLAHEFEDFCDTAAAISALDLVISVDTAVAHLAGAMGKPVWLLLPYSPDWRWLAKRTDSPWYPTMRLFRQPQPGNWQAVIAQVSQALSQTAAQQQQPSGETG